MVFACMKGQVTLAYIRRITSIPNRTGTAGQNAPAEEFFAIMYARSPTEKTTIMIPVRATILRMEFLRWMASNSTADQNENTQCIIDEFVR